MCSLTVHLRSFCSVRQKEIDAEPSAEEEASHEDEQDDQEDEDDDNTDLHNQETQEPARENE
jgi:endogenous inhibitor of DNA gyrase (YacG/DUF329 family)